MKTLQKCDPWEESLVAYYIVMVLPVPQCCLVLNWSWKNRTTPCLYVCGHWGGASQVFYLLLATQQQPLYVLFVLSSLLLHLPPQHWLSNHVLAIGSVKERCNGVLLCNSLLAKLNFEVNYEPQLSSQYTYPKEGYNLRTLEKTVTMVYTTLIGAFGSFRVPVSLRWSLSPLVLVQCVDLLYII